jgi:SHS family lactate transporter-like MFS transporter
MSLLAQLREPTRQQYFAYFAAWSGWVLDAFDFTIFLLVMPQIAKEYGVAHVATASSIALTLLARLAGGWLAGAAADRWGRKLPLLISVIWFALCDGAVAFAPSFTAILVLRTLFGVGMGAEWTSGTTLAMESMPTRLRGLASGVLQGSWAVGYLLAAAISAVVLPRWGWRAMFVIAALPALLALPMRYWVPESPEHAARKAHEAYAFPLRRAFKEEPALLRRLIWGSAVMATGFGAYYGLTGMYPTMLHVELGQTDGGVAWLVALFNVGMMAGSIGVGILATKRGATIAIAGPAALSLLAIPIYAGVIPGTLGIGAVLGGAIGCAFCGATPLVLTSLFPTEVRARLVGLVYHIGAFFAAFVPMSIAALAKSTGMRISTSMMLIAIACEALVVVLVAGPAIAARMTRNVVRRGAAVVTIAVLTIGALALLPTLSAGCLTSSINVTVGEEGGPGSASSSSGSLGDGGHAQVLVQGADPSKNDLDKDVIKYRDLATHPGCTTAGLDQPRPGCVGWQNSGVGFYSAPSVVTQKDIPGYQCAAKQYPTDAEDKTKPILLLIHGNSDAPSGWEKFALPGQTAQPQLAETALAAGFRVYAIDFRYDKVDDDPGAGQANALDVANPGQNMDHGWTVPIAEHFFDKVFAAFPDRQFSMVGFSLGPTVIRDALRRLHRANKKPFERIKDLVFASGAHHGVKDGAKLCASNPTMRGHVNCELGDRTAYEPTAFHAPLNGPDGAFETPCADGDVAFGQQGVCGGHKVRYTTIVMKDLIEGGVLRDEFVNEQSAALKGATNLTVPPANDDQSKYFCAGFFHNHYGAVRSQPGVDQIMGALTAP